LDNPEDAVPGQVADVGHAGERQQVVTAQRREGDVAGHHQLVVALVVGEGGGGERHRREQLGVGGRDPAGGAGQVLVGRVGA
jgi:hypothetical protein